MRFHLSIFLVACIFSLSIQSTQAKAAEMLSTLEVIENVSGAAEEEKAYQDVTTFINSEQVKKELINRGVDPEEALKRLATLSHKEIKNLAEQIKKGQAGGDFGIGGILGVAVFLFLVLLITDILGFTKIFSFTRPIH